MEEEKAEEAPTTESAGNDDGVVQDEGGLDIEAEAKGGGDDDDDFADAHSEESEGETEIRPRKDDNATGGGDDVFYSIKGDGQQGHPFALTFEDVTVRVPSQRGCLPRALLGPARNFFREYFGVSTEEREAFYALDRITGLIKSGETCLVIGRSGSGKSTLLRALSGRLNDTDELYGTASLNGIPIGGKSTLQRWRRMSSYVSASDGSHSPVLTVAETFRFAARCTSDGATPESVLEERVQDMLKLLGLDHVQDTVVGDENLRGVSGGQKRRVTVGEMCMDPKARVLCLDNITDGLASTDSLTLIENVASHCKRSGCAAIVSLLQPSDEIIKCFDRLLVLSGEGSVCYFGPVDRGLLRQVFLGDGVENKGDEDVMEEEVVTQQGAKEQAQDGGSSPARDDSGAIIDLVMNQGMTSSSMCASSTPAPASRSNTSGSDSSGGKADEEQIDPTVIRYRSTPSMYPALVRDVAAVRAAAPHVRHRDRELNKILPKEKYSTSRSYQLRILAWRRAKLISRNAMTYARVVIGIVFGIIVGSLFSALPGDVIGALGRTGYIFLSSFLVLMLSSAVTIPEGFRQRTTLFKHRDSEFYSGKVSYFVQIVLDMPLSVVEATLIAAISYFWVQMNPGAGNFFFFWGTLIGLECAGQAFGRLLCSLYRTQVSANTASSLCIFLFATVGGFMPTYGEITWVLRWLSWLTPVSYAFEAMMINEFHGRNFTALEVGNETVGTIEGDNWLRNQGLPREQWGTYEQIKGFDLGMLFVLALVFDLIGSYYQENTRKWFFNQIRRPQPKVRRRDAKPPLVSQISKDILRATTKGGGGGEAAPGDVEYAAGAPSEAQPQSLSVRSLRYSVSLGGKMQCSWRSVVGSRVVRFLGKETAAKEKREELTLLNDVTARFRRGRMAALMGQSGAGKTTLLDVIAGYKTGGSITGDIMIDGQPKQDSTWKKINGYAEQNDILNPYLSVLETLEFTAACRLPSHVDRQSVISSVLSLMGLDDYSNMIVGREKEDEGLPKHARKRLTIANQLVVLPKVLFLDEPTSGLGANAAALVIGAVRRSTDAFGLITLATIHQPSRKMFEAFDDLILLAKGGRVAYMGELGQRSERLLRHFSQLSGEKPPLACNPADYVLSAIDKVSPDVAVASYQESVLCKELVSDIAADSENAKGAGPLDAHGLEAVNTGWSEFVLLVKRHLLCQWRNPSYSFMRMTVSVGASFALGVLFFQIPKTVNGAVFSIAAIFFLAFVLVIPMQAAVIPLIEDRAVLYREAVSGTYSRISYGLGQLAADIPFHAVNTILMFVSIYFMAGLRGGSEYIGFFIFMLFLANWVVMSMGQLYALVTPNEETATGLAGLSVILSVCLMGFLITSSAMPNGWLWAYWANMFRYILQGLVTNEVAGQEYHLDLSALIPDFDPNDLDLGWIGKQILKALIGFLENGLNLPGEAILFYFGWADFDEENLEFSAPYKWHYCVTAVAVFLIGIETIKLLAVKYVVWTKR